MIINRIAVMVSHGETGPDRSVFLFSGGILVLRGEWK